MDWGTFWTWTLQALIIIAIVALLALIVTGVLIAIRDTSKEGGTDGPGGQEDRHLPRQRGGDDR